MAFQIKRPETAFSNSQRGKGSKKRPRVHAAEHRKWIAQQPCLITGRRDVQAAHVKYADPRFGKPDVGGAEKPDDKWCVPLCIAEHVDQHKYDERGWWISKGIDPVAVASALWASSGDDEAAEIIIREARTKLKS